ncbi:hypothetical protein ANH9381_0786 [Aggregatibacter actinomycetemcomitans ANH9381]|nr:hypothetical protein ANH9381_0786 [Aggregatibacter actinomycetemcomitans ANH9381]
MLRKVNPRANAIFFILMSLNYANFTGFFDRTLLCTPKPGHLI